MSVSTIDSRVFRDLFGTEEARAIFSDQAYVQRLIEVEAALARAESKELVIPDDVGEAISSQARVENIDFDRFSKDTENVGYPVLPLITQLQEKMDEKYAKYLHWGATTQDIMDTATILQIREGLVLVRKLLNRLSEILTNLAVKYRDVPTAGRTHLQHALPVTFGYKLAVYLSSFQRHLQRLNELETRCLVVQFGGAVGTLASLGSDDTGLRVRAQLAAELGLRNPTITWHVARDNIAEVTNFLSLIGGSLGKIALDIILMSSNEVGEVSEPFVLGRGASSTMPQKRNPISSEVILAASKILRANAGLGMDAMVADFERASGPWHLEWACIPESFVICCGALHQTCFVMGGLVVHKNSMLRNLESTKGRIVAEAVMMGLAETIGRGKAHDVIYDACSQSIEKETSLFEALIGNEEVRGELGEERLRQLCDPLKYLGCCQQMIDHVTGISFDFGKEKTPIVSFQKVQ
ncbi:Itaconic acid 2-hydroxyparaconate biosynthesis cluster TAD1 [Hyphodiscus hymeniophilus]|uniref:Itaconic acid 2-hydroxyparaconate biosynthesis cluster TAD1 n=1 Tax=Hyphodiscus hymeniophilus TaxID=353542 RepID=A0A9P6VRM8_9HELO|nr:Itaconic acid 2-hydroxyparaconate biosynthesis cluster TAD1 [Hyphodiscus hymeniophilus]